MTNDAEVDPTPEQAINPGVERGWLYNHIGRLAGTVLGLLAFIGVAFLAAIGSKSALGLLVIIIFGVFVISVGTQLRGGRR